VCNKNMTKHKCLYITVNHNPSEYLYIMHYHEDSLELCMTVIYKHLFLSFVCVYMEKGSGPVQYAGLTGSG
jgi:hypothetical protein